MRDTSSLLHLVWTQGNAMNEAIALEIKTICRRAAEPVVPGETVKAQIRRAWENLGRPPFWRVRAGFYDDRAGTWSAAAVRDFQDRYHALLQRNARRAAEAQAIERAKGARAPAPLEHARDEYRSLILRIEALEAALRLRHEVIGDEEVTASKAITRAEETRDGTWSDGGYVNPQLREALLDVAGHRGKLDVDRLGKFLRSNRDRIVHGLCFCKQGVTGGSARWRVVMKGGEGP